MRKLILISLVLVTPSLLAQQEPPPQDESEKARPAQEQPQPKTAPKLGHPLDPADVDVLTGKTKTSSTPGYPGTAPYPGYPINVAGYVPSRALGRGSLASPRFVPLGFRRFDGRNFFGIRNSGNFGLPLFFFGRGRTRANNFFFAPSRPGFFFLPR